jgi:hypothetical protein
MPVVCRLLDDDRYERTVSGSVDVPGPGLLRLSARQHDHRASVDVALDATPSPGFDVASAGGTWQAPGAPAQDLSDRLSRLAGLRLVPGFRRRVVDILGPEDPRTPYVTDAVIEAARLSRQVTQVEERQVPADPTPLDLRQLDLMAWPEFADMCFTYSAASSGLFERPEVRVPASLDMYVPRPGTRLAFHRYKRATVELTGGVLRLYQSMFDQVHGFELWYDVEAATGRILRARSLTPRLPYMGICDQVQGRHQALVGLALDARWPVTMREATAGAHGCFQLADLTGDVFHLLSLE